VTCDPYDVAPKKNLIFKDFRKKYYTWFSWSEISGLLCSLWCWCFRPLNTALDVYVSKEVSKSILECK